MEEEKNKEDEEEEEEIHNYNAVFSGNATELYSWQMKLFLSGE